MPIVLNRRHTLVGLSSFAGSLAFNRSAAADPPPETTHIRLPRIAGVCIAPIYVAEDLLHSEGFSEVEYVDTQPGPGMAADTASGKLDFSLNFVTPEIVAIDQGQPLTLLGGIHPGCFELFVKPTIETLLDLKGKSIGVQGLGSSPHLFITTMAAQVGLDPLRDINWVIDPTVKPKELFIRGSIDAFLGFPPEPQELRTRKIGRVLVNSAVDHPWAQYFCCLLAGNNSFVAANPVATKRVLRAVLKAADFCISEPARIAKILVERNFTVRYDYALEALRDVPYSKWLDYDAEDAVRYYALRLHEASAITSSPQEIIAKGTDWRFFKELKREMKV